MPLPMETHNAWEIEKLKQNGGGGGGGGGVMRVTVEYDGDETYTSDKSATEICEFVNSGGVAYVEYHEPDSAYRPIFHISSLEYYENTPLAVTFQSIQNVALNQYAEVAILIVDENGVTRVEYYKTNI